MSVWSENFLMCTCKQCAHVSNPLLDGHPNWDPQTKSVSELGMHANLIKRSAQTRTSREPPTRWPGTHFSLNSRIRAFGTIHSLHSGSGLQHFIKACRGQRPRTPSIFQYRGFCLMLIHSYLNPISLYLTLYLNIFLYSLPA